MHVRRCFWTVLICGLITAGVSFAQERTREITVEELYLRQLEFQILKEKAFSGDREMKDLVLDDIEAMLAEDSIGEDNNEVEFILQYLGMEGTTNTVIEGRRLINNFPEIRRRAAELLGKIGGEPAKDALLTMVLRDNEPMVKAEAAYALGTIGLNPNNEVVRALSYALDAQDFTRPDDNFAFAVLLAFEKIAEKNGGINEPEVFKILVQIAQGGYVRKVRAKALQVLDLLRNPNQR